MPKKVEYIIQDDDPDIIHLKCRVGDDLGVFHPKNHREYLPGTEQLEFNQLPLLTGRILSDYYLDCRKHSALLLGRWGDDAINEIINILPKLQQFSNETPGTNELQKLLDEALNSVTNVRGYNIFVNHQPIVSALSSDRLRAYIEHATSCWLKLSEHCSNHVIFEKVLNIKSESFVQQHHFLASVAWILTDTASSAEHIDQIESVLLAPVVFRLLDKAVDISTDGSGKKDKPICPDKFISNFLDPSRNKKANKTLIRNLFLKGWLYHYTHENPPKTQKEMTDVVKKGFPEFNRAADKAMERLLRELRQPGFLTCNLSN